MITKLIKQEKYTQFPSDPMSVDILVAMKENNLADVTEGGKIVLMSKEHLQKLVGPSLNEGSITQERMNQMLELYQLFDQKRVEYISGDFKSLETGEGPNFDMISILHHRSNWDKHISKEILNIQEKAKLHENEATVLSAVDKLLSLADNLSKTRSVDDAKAFVDGLTRIRENLSRNDDIKSIEVELLKQITNMERAYKAGGQFDLENNLRMFEFAITSRDAHADIRGALEQIIREDFAIKHETLSALNSLAYGWNFDSSGELIWNKLTGAKRIVALEERLADALNITREQVSLGKLWDDFLSKNSYRALEQVIRGINEQYVGMVPENVRTPDGILDKFNKWMEQRSDGAVKKTKVALGEKYNLLDENQMIHPDIVKDINDGQFNKVIDRVLPELRDNFLQDFPRLIMNVRSTAMRPTLRIRSGQRLWSLNSEQALTEKRIFLHSLGEEGINLYEIEQSAVIKGEFTKDIQTHKDKKDIEKMVDVPDRKDSNLKEQMKNALDPAKRNSMDPKDLDFMADIPTIRMNGEGMYIEVDTQTPLLFIKTVESIESLNKMYDSRVNEYLSKFQRMNDDLEFRNRISGQRGPIRVDSQVNEALAWKENFKRMMVGVRDIDTQMKFLYYDFTQGPAVEEIFRPGVFQNGEGGFFKDQFKMLKYSKLGGGENVRKMEMRNIRDIIGMMVDNNLQPTGVNMSRIYDKISDIDANNQSVIIKLIKDEMSTRGSDVERSSKLDRDLSVRERVKDDVEQYIIQHDLKNVNNGEVRKRLADKLGDETQLTSLDASVIDGAIYISRDMYELFSILEGFNPNAGEVNGFKGSVAINNQLDVFVQGKGLFIYDPEIALKMGKADFAAGNSSWKDFDLRGVTGESYNRRFNAGATFSDMASADGQARVPFSAFTVRFSGHRSTGGDPVPHGYANFYGKKMTEAVSIWQSLDTKLSLLSTISDGLVREARNELAERMFRHREESGFNLNESAFGWAEQLARLGMSTRNTVLREQIYRFFEEEALPDIKKPISPKVYNSFVIPDLKSKNSIHIDLVNPKNPKENMSAQVKIGEYQPGADIYDMVLTKSNELNYKFTTKEGIDVIFDSNFNVYSSYHEFARVLGDNPYGIQLTRRNRKGDIVEVMPEVPAEVQTFVNNLKQMIETTSKIISGDVSANERRVNLGKVHEFIENNYDGTPLEKHGFSYVVQAERTPRKGISDNSIVSGRMRPAAERNQFSFLDYGPTVRLNPKDGRINAQFDHDGDKLRVSHIGVYKDDTINGFEMFKHIYRRSGVIEDYPVHNPPTEMLNIFNIPMGESGRAGTETTGGQTMTMSDRIMQMASDQMGVGKVISDQGPLTWAKNIDFTINGKKMNMDLETAQGLINSRNLHQRMGIANQTQVDFVNGVNKEMGDPRGYVWFGRGSSDIVPEKLKGNNLFEKPSPVEEMIFRTVIDELREPSRMFNQIYDESGGRNATSYNIQQFYWDIRKLGPNNINRRVFHKLLAKYGRGSRLYDPIKQAEIIKYFMADKDGNITVSEVRDFRQMLMDGKSIEPLRAPIKLDVAGVGEKQMENFFKASQTGKVLWEVVNSEMFRIKNVDEAWGHKMKPERINSHKTFTEGLLDKMVLYRALGIDLSDTKNMDLVFKSKTFNIKEQESAGLIYNVATREFDHLSGRLQYLQGKKYSNATSLKQTAERMNDLSTIITHLKQKSIDRIGDTQKVQKFVIKYGQNQYVKNYDKKNPMYIYRINGSLIKDGKVNYDAISANPDQIIYPGKALNIKRKGQYVVLKNPIVQHRLSKAETIEGLTNYMFTRYSQPAAFDVTMQGAREIRSIVDMSKREIRNIWRDAIKKFRENKQDSEFIFEQASDKIKMEMDRMFEMDFNLKPEAKHSSLELDESKWYHIAKMIMAPDVVSRAITGQGPDVPALPFMQTNKVLQKELFKYITKDPKYEGLLRVMVEEYNQVSDYLSGRSNDVTQGLRPSGLYGKEYELATRVPHDVMMTLLEGHVTPDIAHLLKHMGIGFIEGEKYDYHGSLSVHKVKDLLNNWEVKHTRQRDKGCNN